MDSRSGRRWLLFLCAVAFLIVGFSAASVQAQSCDALSCWVVSLGCNGPFDTGNTICVGGTCICERACNNNTDCGAGQFCGRGRCANALLPCNRNADCPPGFGCGSSGVCAPCDVPGGAQCDPCAGVKCDDGNACNGIEKCVGGRCEIDTPAPNCDDRDPATQDRCVDNGFNRFHCDNYSPSKCSKRPGTSGDLNLTPIGSRSVGLTWSGRIDADLSSRPGDVRILIASGKGAPLFDEQVGSRNGSWRGGSGGWTWTATNRNAPIRRVTLGRSGTFRVEGAVAADRIDLGRVVRPTGAVLIDFVAPDAADICTGFAVPECVPGRDGIQCRPTRVGGSIP